jgi:hypothetical protein
MTSPLDSWDKAAAFGLNLSGTRLGGRSMPVVMIEANGRSFIFTGRESATSFAVMIDLTTVEFLKETEPETYWQSKHYQGYPAVLVRYDSPDPERVRRVIEQAYEQATVKERARPRKKR